MLAVAAEHAHVAKTYDGKGAAAPENKEREVEPHDSS